MNLYPNSVALLFLCLLNTLVAATSNPTHFIGDVSVNCGSSGTSAARDGTEWHGDVHPKFSPLLDIKGSSTTSSVIHMLISTDDPVPHKTARLSRFRFSYSFQVNPGQKILRLHFNPAPYKGFKRFKDLFFVEAGPFTLLSNFSASLTADALGVNSFVKEFCINIEENQQFNIIFSPASIQSLETYAFINGIEIMSVPASLSYFHGGDIGLQVIGKSPVYIDNSTVLEIIHRLNLKQDSVSSTVNSGNIFGMWEMVPKQKPSKMDNITWRTSVDVGFGYMIRLHFSKLGLKMAEIGGITFKVCINEMIAYTNIDIVRAKDDEDSIPMYKDYMVVIKGHKQEGKRDLLICLQSNDRLTDGHGPLKGFEVMKLSNPDNSLASPNPFPSAQDLSYQTIQKFSQLLGYRNMIATIGITLLVLVNIVIYIYRQILEARVTEKENIPSARAERLCRRFSLAEIQSATRNFSDAYLIGKGGFGKVYKGLVDNGQEIVAIKRLKSNSKQGAREFLTEIETLTELRHDNLVSLIGYCNEHREMILVYEYMARGTLADHLYKLAMTSDNCSTLTWKQRLTICTGAARGLDYLHTGNSIIHRDVKASNILLDENFIAKVSDFGLARHLSSKSQSHVSTKVKGTFGYFDPTYYATGRLTRESDIYAFGVVLLEVLSGRPPVDLLVAEDERILIKWARENISKGKADQIVASNLKGEISEDSLKAFVEVAERCLHDEPKKRPTMAQVGVQLELALEQQERSKTLVQSGIASYVNNIHPDKENEMASNVDDIHPTAKETSLSVSTGRLTRPTTDLQGPPPPPEEHSSSNVVNNEPPFDRKDGTRAPTHRLSRLWPWDAFWNRAKPSGYHVKMQPIAVPAIPLDELEDITNNFNSNCLIGGGLERRIYRGVLRSGQAAAIRKLDDCNLPDQKFLAQVSAISCLKHENVVQLLGYCMDDGKRILAHEFASHGSLQDFLHRQQGVKVSQPGPVLSWAERVTIAVGAAKGLEYIHEKTQIHRNIKSSNVLLFDNKVAKIADLDQSIIIPPKAATARTPNTYAYRASGMTSQPSLKSDVYRFGVVLIELLIGHMLDEGPLEIRAMPRFSEDKIKHCIDARLKGHYRPEELEKMAAVAAMCTQHGADHRPNMSTVVQMLQPLVDA